MPDTLEDLRKNLIALEPDGETGFEGLLAALLSDLTKRSFTVASAGSQYGKDGQSALDAGQIVFEAKRYDGNIQKDTIYPKIVEIAADATGTTELYIVAATSRVSTQIQDTLKAAGRQFSLAVEILAWPDTGLPELAVLLAMSPTISAQFIAKHSSAKFSDLVVQLDGVRAHTQFQARANELSTMLAQPSVSPAFALRDNRAWLQAAFSSRTRAKTVFGQPLSPSDGSASGTVDRESLRQILASTLFSKPDGGVVAILGADGNGKSWIFAQTWMSQASPPLTIVIVPDDIKDLPSVENCQDLIVEKLLSQTGETRKAEARERWLRHFQRWRSYPADNRPRILIFLDGINQRETINWPRFIDIMSDEVARLGGRLVFSCREHFYRDNLLNRLVSGVDVVRVPEWTDPELEALLKERGTSISALDAGIVRSLRNPRIFGIAAELFKTHEIQAFGELSVSRLLFEHIRSGSAVAGQLVTPAQFAAGIRVHANRIVERLKKDQTQGITEFDLPSVLSAGSPNSSLSEQFVITSAGRFFEVIDDDPTKYTLKDDGLPLALGLSLVTTVREARRQGQSVDQALNNILDPIAALDRTADILLSAILSAVMEDSPKDIVAPLVRSFVTLQNLDAKRNPEFRALFERAPDSFLLAFEETALSRDLVSNMSWLAEAANALHGNVAFETALAPMIHRWLNLYSLAPDRMVLVPSDSEHAAEKETKLAERREKIRQVLASLSEAERQLLAQMREEDRGDYTQLCLLAFQALAERDRAPFADSLRNWCFGNALNGGYYDHHDDFEALLHFNVTDWESTRDALREATKVLRQPGASRTGQWALVSVLRGTGDSGDAKEADEIADELTKDRESFKGWRRIEDYCATDPCDPASQEPDNIDKTAAAYRAIDVAQLRRFTSQTQDDYFFTAAQPGLARFRPDAAIATLRAFGDQALTRTMPEFRLAVFMLENHTIGLEDRVAPPFVTKAKDIAQAALDAGEDKNREAWVAAQYALVVAFPHMTGDAQFDALLDHPDSATILLNLCYLFQQIDPSKLERALESAIAEAKPVTQFRILCFAQYSKTPLTARTKELIPQLLVSSNDHVRLSILSLIEASADPALLRATADSGWTATTLDSVAAKIEILHGSNALVLAAEKGMITVEACLDRIALSAYENLARRLGAEATLAIADRLNTAIIKASEFQVEGNLPDIEQSFEGRHWPVIFEVSEKPSTDDNSRERLLRLAETGDAWYARQKRNREAADQFERDLIKAGAQLVIQSVTVGLIVEVDKVAPALVDSWCTLFHGLKPEALNNVHNIAALVAQTLSRRDAGRGVALFDHLDSGRPHVRVTFGRDKIALDSVSIWGADDSPEVTALRFSRLDHIGNDHELATEILAAVRENRLDTLRDYVLDRRSRAEPSHKARAVMVAALSPAQPWTIETVDMLKGEHGFLGFAYRGAQYALERHLWSRYWADQMRTATDPVDLWRYTVILCKIVDGRFKSSEIEGTAPTNLIKRFGVTLNDPIRYRIDKWKNKRESKLFGMDMPSQVFLTGRGSGATA